MLLLGETPGPSGPTKAFDGEIWGYVHTFQEFSFLKTVGD